MAGAGHPLRAGQDRTGRIFHHLFLYPGPAGSPETDTKGSQSSWSFQFFFYSLQQPFFLNEKELPLLSLEMADENSTPWGLLLGLVNGMTLHLYESFSD